MGIIAFIAKNWQLGIYAVVVVFIAAAGWHVKSRFARADEADRLETEKTQLETEIEAERDLRQKADEARIVMSGQLDAARNNVRTEMKTVVKTIRQEPVNGACELSAEAVKALNKARGW